MSTEHVSFTRSQLLEGQSRCLKNSLRLTTNARILLEQWRRGASTDLAYALWSLAMEEYGKFLILNEAMRDGKLDIPKNIFNVYFGKSAKHDVRFSKALEDLDISDNINTSAVRVPYNISTASVTINQADDQLVSISIPSGCTGIFEDTSGEHVGTVHSKELRFSSLYVDWDVVDMVWDYPERDLLNGPVSATQVYSITDIEKCMEILEGKLRSLDFY